MKKIVTILILTSLTINLNSQSLVRKFFGGAASALGELFIENIFDDGSDDIIECKLQQLDYRVSELQGDVDIMKSQISSMNRSINSLDLRLTDVEDAIPFGSFGLGYANSSYGEVGYSQLKSLAVIRMMEAQIGLNLNVSDIGLPDNTELERNKNDLNNIIDHLTFGSEDGKAHVSFGRVGSSSFGHSFMFRNYHNNLIYNDQQFGFKAGINHSIVGAELFTSSLSEDRLKAGRIKARPLAALTENVQASPLLTEFGFSYITDKAINGEELKITSVDFNVPYFVGDSDSFTAIYLYGNYAKINENGSGYGVGLAGDYNMPGLGLGFWYEYRSLSSNFATGIFDPFYELGRFSESNSYKRRIDNSLSNTTETSLGAEISFNGFNVSGYYVIDTEDKTKNYVHVESNIRIPILIGDENYLVLALTGAIDQRNLQDLGDFTIKDAINNSSNDVLFSMISSIHYPIGESIDIFLKYSNQDFFELRNTVAKVNTTSALFGLQYNWGLDTY